MQQLKSIKGVSIKSATKLPLPYQVKIVFPLRIAPITDQTFPSDLKERLHTRLLAEIKKYNIINYEIIKDFLQPVRHEYANILDNNVSKIYLHPFYRFTVHGERPYISGYRADLFSIQMSCDITCLNTIKGLDTSTWLDSPTTHKDFIKEIKNLVEKEGKEFNPEFTVYHPLSRIVMPSESAHYLSGYIQQKATPMESLELRWEYSLWQALNQPYPAELRMKQPAQ